MKKHFNLFAALLAVLVLVSCNPNDDGSATTTNDPFTQNFGNSVSRDFIGQVVNESNQPLKGVTVKIGTKTVQTDFNGVFIINNASVYEKFAYITAKKVGYIDGSRAMVPTTGKNNVKIMLISNAPVQTIQSGVASEVSLPNGTKVNFDGAFQDENGNAYSGQVKVSMYHLESSNMNISSLMPGMLYAKDKNGEEKVLETYGMMNVELKGEAGQKLQIRNGHTAQMIMAIDNTQLATAPNSIPLWHFDEAKGYWIEEGSATRVGNNYVGNVSHFSWWNCDFPYETVTLTAHIVDSNGNDLSNVKVTLARSIDINGVSGTSNSEGEIRGLVPANQVLTLKVYNSCEDLVYSSTIGPFSVDTVLPAIAINNGLLTSQISGTFLKCDNTNVTNGYVMANYGNITIVSPVTNGNFNFNSVYCESNQNFRLKGIDSENGTLTPVEIYTFTPPLTNVGTVTACTAIDEYISYQIDNQSAIILRENLSAGTELPIGGGNYLHIQGDDGNQSSFRLAGFSNTPGIYTTEIYQLWSTDTGIIDNSTQNTISFNLIEFGHFDEYVHMTFSGSYTNETGTHTISGVARILRDD